MTREYERRTLEELEHTWSKKHIQELAVRTLDILAETGPITGTGTTVTDWKMATLRLLEMIVGEQVPYATHPRWNATYTPLMEALRYLEYCELIKLSRNDDAQGPNPSNYITRIELTT